MDMITLSKFRFIEELILSITIYFCLLSYLYFLYNQILVK